MKKPVPAISQVDAAALREQRRPAVEHRAEALQCLLPVGREFRRVRDRIREAAWIHFLDHERIDRSRELCRKPQCLGRAFTRASNQRCQQSQAFERFERRRHRLIATHRVKRSANPLVELRIANRDQAWKQKSRSACANEGLGDRPDCSIVRKQYPPRSQSQRVAPELRDQSCSKGVRERTVSRDGKHRRMPGVPVRHYAGRLPSRRWTSAFRRRTRAPDELHRSSGPLRSPCPRICSSRTVPPARPRAAPWT